MSQTPLISILVASAFDLDNLQIFLPRTLDIISGITDYEIVVKATPQDQATCNYVRSLEKFYASLRLISIPDSGLYEALNQGLDHCRGRYTIILGSDDYFFCDPLLCQPLLRSALNDTFSLHYFPVYLNSAENVSEIYSSMGELPLFKNIQHQGLLVPTSVLRDYPFLLCYRFAADYHQYLRLLRSAIPWHFWNMPFVVFSTQGMSKKGNIHSKIVGHSENIRALLVYSPVFALMYIPLMLFRKLVALFA